MDIILERLHVQIFNIEDNPPGMTFPPDKGLLVQTRKLELILGWFESFIFIFSQDLSDLRISQTYPIPL